MEQSTSLILFISVLIIAGMTVISSIIYYFERDKRQLLSLEYWLSNGAYFLVAYLTNGMAPTIVALATGLWLWRLIILRKILESVCETKLKKSWHLHFLIYSYLIAVFAALYGLDFVYYTIPQALAFFMMGVYYLWKSFFAFKKRGMASINHWLLLITIFIIIAHVADYPFYRFDSQFAFLGFSFSLLCNLLMAIILPSVTIYELRREQEKKLEKLVVERGNQLVSQSKFSALGAMTAGIAHEINNPMGIIYSRTSHLRSHVLKDSAQKDFIMRNLDQIEKTSERIFKIINSLRDYSRDNKNDPFQKCLLSKVIEDTLTYCSDRFHMNGVMLDVDSCSEVMIECRPVQVSQVVLNLLNNSFDAVVNTPAPWITIKFKFLGNKVQIIVQDSGGGVPKSICKNIMEPFFTTKGVMGTGLGLSISKGIIEDHQGFLYYDESSINTTFVVELPYQQS